MDRRSVEVMSASPKYAVCLMAAVLGLLVVYSFFQPGVLEPAHCQRSAANCVDRVVQLAHHARVVELFPNGFVIEQLGATTQVVGDNAGLVMGDYIHLRGVWQADGTIRAEAWHVSRHWNWRVLVSIPAAMVGAWLFGRAFSRDGSKRAFVTRDHA
jgi:hypothetical protein